MSIAERTVDTTSAPPVSTAAVIMSAVSVGELGA